jgi:cell division protein FtsL
MVTNIAIQINGHMIVEMVILIFYMVYTFKKKYTLQINIIVIETIAINYYTIYIRH